MRFTVASSVNQMNYFLQNSFASLDPFPLDMANVLRDYSCKLHASPANGVVYFGGDGGCAWRAHTAQCT